MRHKFLSIVLTLCLAISVLPAAMVSADTIDLGGHSYEIDSDGSYLLQDLSDWDALAEYVAAGNDCAGLTFKLANDIGSSSNPITKPIGRQTGSNKSDRKRFAGEFDGDNHTITIQLDSSNAEAFPYNKGYCTPFAYTKAVSISNLTVKGSIVTTGQWASGLVGQAGEENSSQVCNISNCLVSVSISASYSGGNGNNGGLIGIAEGGANITNTVFDGSFEGTNFKYSGGFIGLNKKPVTITNSLFAPSFIADSVNSLGSRTFVHNLNEGTSVILNGAYYTRLLGDTVEGIQVYAGSYSGTEETETITFISGEYYYFVGSSEWRSLQRAMAESGSVVLDKDYVAVTNDTALVVPSGVEVTLDLNGYSIDRNLDYAIENGCVIKVEAGAKLTINDSSHDHTGVITGGYNRGNGGGICCEGELIMDGVSVTGNIAEAKTASEEAYGGGIYLSPEDTSIMNRLRDCNISNNKTILKAKNTQGGGLYIAKGTVGLDGCTISYNESHNAGGGVYILSGEVTFEDCNVSNNTAYAGATGGGIYLKDGDLTLNGYSNEGMVVSGNMGNKGNASTGAGIYVEGGTFAISGKVTIKDNHFKSNTIQKNVYLADDGIDILVLDEISGSEIGVSVKDNIARVFTYRLRRHGDAENFFSDETTLAVGVNAYGEAFLGAQYNVTVADGIENGSVVPDSAVSFEDEVVTLDILPAEGYVIDTLSYNDGTNDVVIEADENGVYSFVMPAADVVISATFVEIPVPTEPSFATQNLILSGKIGVSFNMNLPQIEGVDYENSYMTFTITHGSITERANFDAGKTSPLGYYKFVCYINSVQMAETITATFHYTVNGEEKTISEEYSVEQYFTDFENEAGNYTTDMQDMVEALADFGYYVQPFLAEQRNWTLGEKYLKQTTHYTTSYNIAEVKAAVSDKGIEVENNTDGDIENITYSLLLESATSIKVYFTPASSYTGEFSASLSSGTGTCNTNKVGTRYVVEIPNISAHKLSQEYQINVVTDNGTATIKVSALSYVKGALDYYTDDTVAQNAVAAIYYYAKAADTLLGEQQ